MSPFFTDHLLDNHAPIMEPRTIQNPTIHSIFPSNAKINTAAIEYPTATANYGTVVAVGIFDASSSGNLLAYANLTSSKVVSTGDVFRFNAGDLDITLA